MIKALVVAFALWPHVLPEQPVGMTDAERFNDTVHPSRAKLGECSAGFVAHFLAQGFPNCVEGDCGKDDSCERSVEHQFSPPRHALLSIKIAGGLLSSAILIYLAHFGLFKVADRAFDAFERGRKVYGLGLAALAAIIAIGSAFALPWLIFGSGLFVGRP